MNGICQPAESRTTDNGDFGVSQRVLEPLGKKLGSFLCPLKGRNWLVRHGPDVETVLVNGKTVSSMASKPGCSCVKLGF